jgi:hypothetical protein
MAIWSLLLSFGNLMALWNTLYPFGIFYGLFGIFYEHLVFLSRFGMLFREKSCNPDVCWSSRGVQTMVFRRSLRLGNAFYLFMVFQS